MSDLWRSKIAFQKLQISYVNLFLIHYLLSFDIIIGCFTPRKNQIVTVLRFCMTSHMATLNLPWQFAIIQTSPAIRAANVPRREWLYFAGHVICFMATMQITNIACDRNDCLSMVIFANSTIFRHSFHWPVVHWRTFIFKKFDASKQKFVAWYNTRKISSFWKQQWAI